MNDWTAGLSEGMNSNDPFGVSRFSIRRYSVQHLLLIIVVILLLVSMIFVAAAQGNVPLLALSLATLSVVLLKTSLLVRVGVRTIAVEAWIRRLGMGDFDYRIEPRGNDEVSKACLALETLRLNCQKAMQLDLVTQLSEELGAKNGELEQALADLQESQDRIISQQKLAELGELSSGVAHEMRNPLQFIANFTESSRELAAELLETLNQPDHKDLEKAQVLVRDISDNLGRVERHTGRLKSISSAMIVYDRGTGGGFRPLDLNRLLEEQTNLGHRSVQAYEPGFSADITMQLDPAIGEVVAVPEDLARMIVNLVMNACQSMAEKRRGAGDEYGPVLTVTSENSGGGVSILVQDNGAGMDRETQSRMYNPFFTTWNTGRNTGLGLSLVWDIIREHGGNIEVESELGQGTVVKVVLPGGPDIGMG